MDDDEYGYPLTWTVREYDWETDEMYEAFRAEYSDYTDCSMSSIQAVDAPTVSSPIYYDIRGRKVDNPSAGIFIQISGERTEKVIIR